MKRICYEVYTIFDRERNRKAFFYTNFSTFLLIYGSKKLFTKVKKAILKRELWGD